MRTTESEVKAIIDTDLDEDAIAPFLRVANLLVTELLSDEGYDAPYLAEIERWLAAHLVAVRDPRIISQKIGDADATYTSSQQLGQGLSFTSYGQQVLLLDIGRRFAALQNSKRPVEVKVIG